MNTGGGKIRAGEFLGSSATIDIKGGTLAQGNGQLYLGYLGAASLLLHGGGTITQGETFLGVGASGSGIATVANATWSANYITVGYLGTGSLTVLAGGTVNTTSGGSVGPYGGNGTVNLNGGSWLSAGGFSIGVSSGGVGTSIVHVNTGGSLTASGSSGINLYPGGTLDIAGGEVSTSDLYPIGGHVQWSSGSLTVLSPTGLMLGTLTFGNGLTLGSSQSLNVTNALTLPSGQLLTLAGGNVTAGSLAGPGTFNLQTGNFTVANSSLTIGTSGPLGPSLTVGTGLNLRVTGVGQTLTVGADGAMYLTGGSAAGTSIANAGDINFASPAATLGLAGQTLTNTGRLSGTGRINANLTNNASGRIIANSGQQLIFTGASNNNKLNGRIEITGGTVEFTGTLNNATGGTIAGRGTFRGSSANASGTGLSNSGVVAFSTGVSDVFGKVSNLGGGAGGQIINAGAGTVTFYDDVAHNGQEIRTTAGGRTIFLGAVSGAGPFTGIGTVEFDGNLSPGNSTARATFAGNVDLGYSTNLQIELGGTSPGTEFDQLQIAGKLSLDGMLTVSLINGFSPVVGNTFDIFDWASLAGEFSNVILAPLPIGLGWDKSQLYTSGTLSVVSVAIPGDYNLSNAVDAADYVTWRKVIETPSAYDTWRKFRTATGQRLVGYNERCCPGADKRCAADACGGWLVLLAKPDLCKSPGNASCAILVNNSPDVTPVF